MLAFPGHFFGAYLFVRIFTKLTKRNISRRVLTFAILASLLLDLDVMTAPLYGMQLYQHHRFLTHTPFFWVVVFGILYIVFKKFSKKDMIYLFPFFIAIITHFVLDTPEDGIMWLYPFSDKLYGLYFVGQDQPLNIWVPRYLRTPAAVAQEFLVAVVALVTAERTRDLYFVLGDLKGNLRRKLSPLFEIDTKLRLRYAFFHWFFHMVFIIIPIVLLKMSISQIAVFTVGSLLINFDHLPFIFSKRILEFTKPIKYKLHNYVVLSLTFLGSLLLLFGPFKSIGIFFLGIFLHLSWDYFEDVFLYRIGKSHWKA